MTMHITILTLKDLEVRGHGIPRYIRELYCNLKNLEKSEDIEVEKFNFPEIRKLGDALSCEIGSIFNKLPQSDIIHITTGFFIIHNIPKNTKVISTIHDTKQISPHINDLSYFLKFKRWYYIVLKRGMNYNLKISDAIIANSSQTKEEIIKLGVNESKIFVVNLGLDKRFLITNIKSKNNYSKKFNVGYIGAFAINKNVNFILDSARILKEKVNFNIYGFKTYSYQKLLKDASDLKNLNFRGSAPENKLIDIYDSFDAFVFPSLYEGFGLPILEAQARGLPVIIYKYGKIPKEVRKYCFEAESPKHMAQIIEDLKENGYNEKLRKKATEYARSFTWERCAKETLEVYKRALK